MTHRTTCSLSAVTLLATLLAPTEAAAGRDACGIDLWSIEECHVEISGGCEAACEPWSFVAACEAECNASVDAACDLDCSAACVTECQTDPGHFDCEATCEARCEASAAAQCGCDQECIAVAEAHCSASCQVECEYVPPSASCQTQCEAACTGACDVEANVDCFANCSFDLQGGCEVDCEEPEGALFCDGQYIPVDDLAECVVHLEGRFDLEIEGEATGYGSFHCATAEAGAAGGSLAAWLLGLGFVAFRRRRSLPTQG
ncbi:MAG: hypothetical protein JRI23_35135 [Deltaproteobacteria bacterium]|jgi:MYXO-CTERM domain-containing protein|nr:hypothetical protein [Deltaproteobacteria bacterium]MBW2537548.1 hypothetical protein [Deltaproteobacteria bacterium]